MGVLTSHVVRDETFERATGAMEALVAELRERTALVARTVVERRRSNAIAHAGS